MSERPSHAVLIVDDDEAIRFLFKMAVEQMGCEVFTASNGRDGLQRLATMPKPQLILLDLMMPEMDGWDFLAAMDARPEWRGIPVVACTAFNVHVNDLNVKGVLTKPVDLADLSDTVRRWCPVESSAPHAAGPHVE